MDNPSQTEKQYHKFRIIYTKQKITRLSPIKLGGGVLFFLGSLLLWGHRS